MKFLNKHKYIVIGIFIALIFFTSYIPKMKVNDSTWPYDIIRPIDMPGYVNLPKGEAVYSLCADQHLVLGFGAENKFWDKDVMAQSVWLDKHNANNSLIIDRTPADMYSILKEKKYDYIFIESHCVDYYNNSVEKVNEKLNEIANSGYFKYVNNTDSTFLFAIS